MKVEGLIYGLSMNANGATVKKMAVESKATYHLEHTARLDRPSSLTRLPWYSKLSKLPQLRFTMTKDNSRNVPTGS